MIVPEDAAATMNRMLRRASPANLPGDDPTPVALRETTWHTAKTGMFTDDDRSLLRPTEGHQRAGRPRTEAPGPSMPCRLLRASALPTWLAGQRTDPQQLV